MDYNGIQSILKTSSLRAVLESKKLAQLGDFLANFVYTTVKIGLHNLEGSTHVWDKSLTKAMDLAGLRSSLGKKTKPDKVADAGEAFIAFAYFNNIMDLDEMIEILGSKLDKDSFRSEKKEKEECAIAFSELFIQIMKGCDDNRPLTRLIDE